MSVEDPRTLLTLLATVFRPPASPALGELPCELLPFPALVISTLSYSAAAIILPAQIPHHHSSPVLHILAVVADGKFFDKREDVEIVGEEVFFFFGFAGGGCGG